MSRIRRGARRGHGLGLPPLHELAVGLLVLGAGSLTLVMGTVVALLAVVSSLAGVVAWWRAGAARGEGHPQLLGPDEFRVLGVSDGGEAAHCPVCAAELGEEAFVACPRCATPHHRDCWDFNGACAVFGCGGVGRVAERGSATDSSLPPSLPSSPSPSDVLTRRFRRWFWLTRIQWWSLLSLSVLVCDAALLNGLGAREGRELVMGPVIGLGAVSALFLTASVLSRRRLEGSLQGPVAVPPDRLARLLRRIEHSETQPILSFLATWFPIVYLVAAAGVGARGTSAGAFDGVGIVAGLVGGAVFAFLARWSVRRHARDLNMVRWRLRRQRSQAGPERGRP